MKKRTVFTNLLVGTLCIGFLLGIHNGRIGIWKDPDPTPMRVIPCPVFLLTPEQQNMLSDGIRLDTMEDLEYLIENFFP